MRVSYEIEFKELLFQKEVTRLLSNPETSTGDFYYEQRDGFFRLVVVLDKKPQEKECRVEIPFDNFFYSVHLLQKNDSRYDSWLELFTPLVPTTIMLE